MYDKIVVKYKTIYPFLTLTTKASKAEAPPASNESIELRFLKHEIQKIKNDAEAAAKSGDQTALGDIFFKAQQQAIDENDEEKKEKLNELIKYIGEVADENNIELKAPTAKKKVDEIQKFAVKKKKEPKSNQEYQEFLDPPEPKNEERNKKVTKRMTESKVITKSMAQKILGSKINNQSHNNIAPLKLSISRFDEPESWEDMKDIKLIRSNKYITDLKDVIKEVNKNEEYEMDPPPFAADGTVKSLLGKFIIVKLEENKYIIVSKKHQGYVNSSKTYQSYDAALEAAMDENGEVRKAINKNYYGDPIEIRQITAADLGITVKSNDDSKRDNAMGGEVMYAKVVEPPKIVKPEFRQEKEELEERNKQVTKRMTESNIITETMAQKILGSKINNILHRKSGLADSWDKVNPLKNIMLNEFIGKLTNSPNYTTDLKEVAEEVNKNEGYDMNPEVSPLINGMTVKSLLGKFIIVKLEENKYIIVFKKNQGWINDTIKDIKETPYQSYDAALASVMNEDGTAKKNSSVVQKIGKLKEGEKIGQITAEDLGISPIARMSAQVQNPNPDPREPRAAPKECTELKEYIEKIRIAAKAGKNKLAIDVNTILRYKSTLLDILSYDDIIQILKTTSRSANNKFNEMFDELNKTDSGSSTPLDVESFQGYSSFPLVEGMTVDSDPTYIPTNGEKATRLNCLTDKFMLERISEGHPDFNDMERFQILHIDGLGQVSTGSVAGEEDIEITRERAIKKGEGIGKYQLTDPLIILALVGSDRRERIINEYFGKGSETIGRSERSGTGSVDTLDGTKESVIQRPKFKVTN